MILMGFSHFPFKSGAPKKKKEKKEHEEKKIHNYSWPAQLAKFNGRDNDFSCTQRGLRLMMEFLSLSLSLLN